MSNTFTEELTRSKNKNALAVKALNKIYPDKTIREGTETEDKNGCDFFADDIGIDVKFMGESFNSKSILFEVMSVVETGKLGWSLRTDKQTKQVLYIYEETGLFVLFDFNALRNVLEDFIDEWKEDPGLYTTTTNSANGKLWTTSFFVLSRSYVSAFAPILAEGYIEIPKKDQTDFMKHLRNKFSAKQ